MNEIPNHYQGASGLTCADFIRDIIKPEGMECFWRGNALKYIYRAGTKGGSSLFENDIRKAINCLEFLILERNRSARQKDHEQDASKETA